MRVDKIIYMVTNNDPIDKKVLKDNLKLSSLLDYLLSKELYAVSKTEYEYGVPRYQLDQSEQGIHSIKNTITYENYLKQIYKWNIPLDPEWWYEILDKDIFLVIEFTRRP